MKRLIYPTASIVIIIIEIFLCFIGPMALMTTPSLMVAPIYNAGGSGLEVEETFKKIEQLTAKTGSFNVLSKQRLEDYFISKGEGDIGFSYSKKLNYKEYLKIGEKLGIDRVMFSTLSVTYNRVQLITILRDVKSGEIIYKKTFNSDSLENLLENKGLKGKDLNMEEELTIGTNGISLFDKLFFVLIFCQLLYTVLYVKKREKRGYEEFILSFSLMMFLFALIYALNANMSYVQFFIAQMGEIGMAESTEREQLFVSIRFLPFIIINSIIYIKKGIMKKSIGGYKEKFLLWGLPITLLSAFLYSMSFPSFLNIDGFSFLAWFSLVPLFLIIQLAPRRVSIFYGIIWGGLQSIIINYWHGTFKLIALPFSTVVTILMYTPFIILLVNLLKGNRKFNFLIIPVVWVVFDYLRSVGFTGYPWGIIGTTQYRFIYFNQLASITGIWGLSFILLLSNGVITHSILNFKEKYAFLGIKVFLPIFIVTVIFGGVYTSVLDREEPEKTVRISLIQQNSDPRRHEFYKTFDSLKELTDRSIDSWGITPDLVVWPEGAFKEDIRFFSQYSSKSSGVGELREFVKDREIWLLTGSQDREIKTDTEGEENRLNYNSAVFLNPLGEVVDVYHKIHLVPFSEYFPYKDSLPFIAGLLERFNTSNWTQGERRFSFSHPEFSFSTPICFEDVFSSELREFVIKDSDIFVNISNDFWAMTPVEAKQHGVNALYRTIENRRPMVRATCSGYTVHFDRVGRIVEEAEGYYVKSFVNAEVPLFKESKTIYTILGDWFPIILSVFIITLLIFKLIIGLKRLINRSTK